MSDWYELVALQRDGKVEVLSHETNTTYIHGKIGDVTIARIETGGLRHTQVQQSIEAAKVMLDKAGIKPALIMPTGIELLRICRVEEPALIEMLERKYADQIGERTTVH